MIDSPLILVLLGGGVVAALVGLVACGSMGSKATALASVDEAVDHPDAREITFTGVARTSVRGVHTFGTKHPRSVGSKDMDLHEMWVVPVDDAGGTPSDPVTLWVTPSFTIDEGTDPDEWFASLQKNFDGAQHTIRVRGRASESDAGWAKAIEDAEQKHGVASHPQAAVVPWPPKG